MFAPPAALPPVDRAEFSVAALRRLCAALPALQSLQLVRPNTVLVSEADLAQLPVPDAQMWQDADTWDRLYKKERPWLGP